MATTWSEGKQEDIEGWEMRLPDGQIIPQIKITQLCKTARGVKTNNKAHGPKRMCTQCNKEREITIAYRYLGAEILTGWRNRQELSRDDVRKRLIHKWFARLLEYQA